VEYNVSELCISWQIIEHTKALPSRRSFYAFREEKPMAVSYKKLWKILIDKDIKKKDLSTMAGISPATITKMGKNGHVTTEVLIKICTALNCGLDDIMEILPTEVKE
jgi:DNA-binding Xre family transcriptional regulator